jgi:HAE1 family hydrophobic/amphiphilic exporter-1
VVIGGLVSSTLLTLVLVPTLYTMVENRKEKSRANRDRRRARKLGRDLPAETPKHAAGEPNPVAPAGVPDSSGGAHEAPGPATAGVVPTEAAQPTGALRGHTDQFEVLKMPRRPAGPPA